MHTFVNVELRSLTGVAITFRENDWHDIELEVNDGKGGDCKLHVDWESFRKFVAGLQLMTFQKEHHEVQRPV